MQIASVSVFENQAKASNKKLITAGMVGATVAFDFDESWSGFRKTLVWRGSGRTIDDTLCTGKVPPEVVAVAGDRLVVGAYGVKEGVITPTVWVDLGSIVAAADPSGDESADPSLPVWYESQKTAEQAVNIAEQTDRKVDETYQHISGEFTMVRELVDVIGAEAENAKDIAGEAAAVAKGRATGYVFDTVEDLDLWLSDEVNTVKIHLGDNFYIRAVNVPDYWWDGKQKQPLETQKVDLSEYVKKTDYTGSWTPGLVTIAGFDSGNYGFIKGNQEVNPASVVINRASDSDIRNKTQLYKPIVPKNLDYAVLRGVAYNAKTMTTAEKKAACKWFGTLNVIENSDGSITITMPSGKTKTVDLSKIEIFL